ncbi:MAG: hypothetical protein HYS60_02695 [Candidatus Wildermuthbacteria bacterium]|nr:hypothetical protein [Candidatus Wildermuthbacteria bacterium]
MNSGTTKQSMALERLILSMFDAVSYPLTHEEFSIVQIPWWHILKRRYFSNLYRTVILYLVKQSIVDAFPENAPVILIKFQEIFNRVYQNSPTSQTAIEADLLLFDEMTDKWKSTDRFLKLTSYVVDQIEKSSKRFVYAAQLAVRLESTYEQFVSIGDKVKLSDENLVCEYD